MREKVSREVRNRGSMTIEVTLLMPFLLMCIVLYITAFLDCVEVAKAMDNLSETLYCSGSGEKDVTKGAQTYQQGSVETAVFRKEKQWSVLQVEMRKYAENPVENLRRWQVIADTVYEGGNP